MNPVLLLVRDNFEMNKRCIDSIFAQDVPTTLVIIDNSECDDTFKWATENRIAVYPFRPQIGVSRGWNLGLSGLFRDGYEHVLVPNSDTVMPPSFYRRLLAYNVPFVSGRETTSLVDIEASLSGELGGGPQFSAFLIRKSAWDAIGPFDADMDTWASDCDYHVRAHRKGILLQSAPVLYYHERSSTLRLADSKARRIMELQADADRMVFTEKWGVPVWSPEYVTLFSDSTFGVDRDTI